MPSILAQMHRHSLHSYLKGSPSSDPAPSRMEMSVQLDAERVVVDLARTAEGCSSSPINGLSILTDIRKRKPRN